MKTVLWKHQEVLEFLEERWNDSRPTEELEPVLVVHKNTDVDEMVCLWQIITFATGDWKRVAQGLRAFMNGDGDEDPGIRILFWGAGNLSAPLGHTAGEWEAKGVIAIGTWGGRLDEHTPDGKRIEGECAATLVAETLGVYDDPGMGWLLRYVLERDLTPSHGPADVASVVKLLTEDSGKLRFLKALQFTFAFCDARYDDKEKRAVFTEAEYDGLAFKKEIVFTGSNGHPLKAVLLESANPQAASVAWARGAALVVLRNPDGHTVIMRSRLYHWLDLAPLARALRVEELRAQQKSLPGDLSSLGKVGVIPEVPEWFLPDWEAGNRTMLANGTKTHPDVPVTKLTGEQIMDIAVKVMNPNAWAPGFAAHCRVGNCTSGVGNKGCPLAAWNMPRCVEMRRRTLAELRLRRDAPKPAAPKAKPAPTSSPETVKERATDMSAQSAEPTAALNTTPSV